MAEYNADGAVIDDTPLTDADVFDTPADGDAEVVPAATPSVSTETAVAVKEETKAVALAEQWPHDYLQFEGDRLEVRLPSEQALSAFSISVSKYMPADVQNDMVGLFIAKHLSPESYTHVFARMMDPDDTEYSNKTVGQLMSTLSKLAVEKRRAEAASADKPAS